MSECDDDRTLDFRCLGSDAFLTQRLDRKGQAKPLRRKPPRPRLDRKAGAKHVGHYVAFDTIIRFIEGSRRYIPTATDHSSRFAFVGSASRQ